MAAPIPSGSIPIASLAVGTLVMDTHTTYNGVPIIWKIMEHNHSGDPNNSTALITDKIISLKCFDANEYIEETSINRHGNDNYRYSNLLQWLNSDLNAGEWYTAKHSDDTPPTNDNVLDGYNEYDQEAGFLFNFRPEMKKLLLDVGKITVSRTVEETGNTVTSKIFLLSATELGFSGDNIESEGTVYELFDNDPESRLAYPTSQACSISEYKDDYLNDSEYYPWLTRSIALEDYGSVRLMSATPDELTFDEPYAGYLGVRPACCINANAYIKEEPVTVDGYDSPVYVLKLNSPPTIFTDFGDDLGNKSKGFTFSFIVNDIDSNTGGHLYIYLDGEPQVSLSSYTMNSYRSYTIDDMQFSSLSMGEHAIKIVAYDDMERVDQKIITFNKVPPVTIGGEDKDLGMIWSNPLYSYTVCDYSGDDVTVYEYLDDNLIKTIQNAPISEAIIFDFGELFENLESETSHTMQIKAINSSGYETYRTITFTKIPSKLEFQTNPISTDMAVKRIIVKIDYDKNGSPDIKVEVSNDASADTVHWEDATEAYKANNAYNFQNVPESGFGVAIRVTISKKPGIERVYCNGFGFCYD